MPAIIKRLVVAGLAAFALGAVATSAAEPALWAIKDGQSTIHLFGTIHVLEFGMEWQSPKIAKAFNDSADLWLELTDDDPATLQPLIASLGLDPEHPLSGKLSASELARVDAAARTAGLPNGEEAFDTMRPWMAAISLAAVPILQSGFDSDLGADHVLKSQAMAAGKALHAFESAAQQLHFFADLPAAEELDILRSALDDVAKGPDKIREMAAAWLAGDVPAITGVFAEFSEPQYRALYQVLIAQRNEAWATKLVQRLKTGSGTSFVAVGTGHLVGPDSLIVALAKRGIAAERE
jgi:uncharacterized protein YbaP (TraB family)